MSAITRRAVMAGAAALLLPRPAFAQQGYAAATAYNAARSGISFLVMRDGRIEHEDYPNGGAPDRPHELASGTKSFCGVVAAAAVQDRLLELDEPAMETLPEWRDDPVRRRITIRQILDLTSGLATRRARGDLMEYEESMELPALSEPGTGFAYGGDPFQLFGLILHRKLRERETPVAYLRRRLLDPAGIAVGAWRDGPDGLPRLGSGARLTARDWARFGDLVRRGCVVEGRPLVDPAALAACFQGSRANPAYGLGWWLNRPMPPEQRAAIPQLANATGVRPEEPAFPRDLVLAAGAGQQRLFVSQSERLVIVRQAGGIRLAQQGMRGGARYTDSGFWRALRGLPQA
jgi:CubicO group peptidase (beta-lactamase class C family)